MTFRSERYLTARDLAERLLPDLKMNEFLLWPPDLFAFTSYVLSHTGAYQLVVSPPRGQKWGPRTKDILEWFEEKSISEALSLWLTNAVIEWCGDEFSGDIEKAKAEATALGEKYDLHARIRGEFTQELNPADEDDAQLISILNTLSPEPEPAEKDDEPKINLEYYFNRSGESGWNELVTVVGDRWKRNLRSAKESDLDIVDDYHEGDVRTSEEMLGRSRELLEIILKTTPPTLIGIWALFYNNINDLTSETLAAREERKFLQVSSLLCNEEDTVDPVAWKLAQLLLTMHAIADLCCLGWGIRQSEEKDKNMAQAYAESLLFTRGSLSTINPQRCRIMPKRHNPELGITLRSVSGNLAFHRSSVDVVWRKARNNSLVRRLSHDDDVKDKISILLIPYPFNIETTDFSEAERNDILDPLDRKYGFFEYSPGEKKWDIVKSIISRANEELSSRRDKNDGGTGSQGRIPKGVDIIIFPETALSKEQEQLLVTTLEKNYRQNKGPVPSIIVAGVREERDDQGNFSKNVVYCKYFDDKGKEWEHYRSKADEQKGKKSVTRFTPGYGDLGKNLEWNKTPKYKQHKHHRWKLTSSQITQFGLSMVLDHNKIWWESTKVPRRRVSFLNVGEKITICSLICEDLARQDPIADLIRHVGPSLVITILMDGPQTRNRWASRYATVLSDDPGSSVITLTSYGMVRRYTSPYNEMSRVVAMWSEKDKIAREIELSQGARGILLTLEIESEKERTADGREETVPTSVLRLLDVIQIYPDVS